MPQLIAEASFRYATRHLQPGDEFEASEKDAKILKLAKRARDAGAGGDLLGEAAGAGEGGGRRRRGGTYGRRDMRAES